MIKKTILSCVAVAAMTLVFILPTSAKTPKYVFYMIGDGMGINEVYSAQTYNKATGNGPENINFFQFPVRTFVSTYSASSLVTDSAAAGTALATGQKTNNGSMGVGADGNPVSDICEWAQAAGFGTGVATTVGVNHATPAAFYAHTSSRNNYETIAEQLIASKIAFAAGGGIINEKKKTGHDSKYLEDKVAAAGIPILRGEQLKTAGSQKGRVLCLASDTNVTDLPYAIDRKEGDTKLADFVQAGVEYLYNHFAKKGFIFMVEGGSIDHAGHSDDGVSDFWEINDFAEAIDVVLAFYNQHPDETLIVVTADHETGALIPGAGRYELRPELLGTQKNSEDILNVEYKKFVNENGGLPSWDDAKEFFKKHLGLWGTIKVDPRTENALKETFEKSVKRNEGEDVVSLYSVSTKIVSDALDYMNLASGYHWAHGSHSGSPVGLYVKGSCANEFLQCRDNTDIPKTIARVAKYVK